ncbi:MAG: NAD(P)/FAD-dependent oxidoreductase [Antricoccus sp.]
MTQQHNSESLIDAVIIGGGATGLQAALTLARIRRSVVLLDSGEYRNKAVAHMHNFITHDGDSPANLRKQALSELTNYDTVDVRFIRAEDIAVGEGEFSVALSGGDVPRARCLILATGMADILPEKPGLAPLWGNLAAQCPFCHGYEYRGQHLGVLGAVAGPHVSILLESIADKITIFADREELSPAKRDSLTARGVVLREESVVGFERSAGGEVVVHLDGTDDVQVASIFLTPEQVQAAPFAEKLGLEMLPSGAIRIDDMGRTSMTGVYAAGDLAHVPALPMPLPSVLAGAAAGQRAASALATDLMVGENPWILS